MQARFVTVADGVLTVEDEDGETVERVELASARAELKRGLVEIATGDRSFFLYGYGSPNKVPEALVRRLAAAEPDESVAPGGMPWTAMGASQDLLAALERHGATVR